MDPLHLQARGIRKSFAGVEVLHGVDLDARGGSVLALLGENGAGKSTLVKTIAGDLAPDGGELVIDGEAHRALTPRQARQLGIAIIFQEFQDAPTLTVAENICLGRLPSRRGVVSWRAVRRRAVAILDELGVDIDPAAIIGDLRVGERQIVEIARALSGEARLLILDEPTAALSHHEAMVLFDFIRRLRERGVAIVYITHRLDEVTEVADRVQVLRDGDTALTADVAEVDRPRLISAMVGRELAAVQRPESRLVPEGTTPVLAWRGARLEGAFRDVDLEVHAGEVVALFGKLGSGAGEVGETGYGLRPLDDGRLEVGGEVRRLARPTDAIGLGIGFLPAERKASGAFLVRSVAENVAIASWPTLSRGGILTDRIEAAAYDRWHTKLAIRSRNDPRQIMETLSGGNQQKVLLARWLERRSRVLILIEPTRGVDVGARSDIYDVLRALAADGLAVLIITSDYEEAVQVADRTYVIAKGALVAELRGAEIATSTLLAAAGG
jgi:ribose transport system ATP-binding protein